jgi:hypothetical protein
MNTTLPGWRGDLCAQLVNAYRGCRQSSGTKVTMTSSSGHHRKPTPKRLLLALAFASATTLSACGGSSSSSNTASVSSISKCAHARPQTMSAITPTERMIAQKVVPGGSLFQSAGEETEAEEQAHAPGFNVYVFKDDATAKEALGIFEHAQSSGEFGGGGTFLAKNVIIDTDQNPPSSLDSFADELLKKCVGSSATASLHRTEEDSSESAGTEAPSEASPTGEVGAPSQAEASAGQSPYPGERR